MIAQMAQFSMVTGQTEMNESIKLFGQLSEFRIATAANMLGHSALVSGNKAFPDAEGTISGALTFFHSTSTSVLYKSMNGDIVHAEELGPQQAGLLGFAGKRSRRMFSKTTNISLWKHLLIPEQA